MLIARIPADHVQPDPPIDPFRGSIGDAFAIATLAHQGQKYGDGPYIEHPIAVARLLLTTFGLFDHLIVPALLHDVVEDTPVQLHEIERQFGKRTATIVDGVTRRPGEIYSVFIGRAASDRGSLLVKLADNTHNLSTLPSGDRRERRYFNARRVLLDAYGDDDPWADAIGARAGAL